MPPARPLEPLMTATDARLELHRLHAERLDAADAGLLDNALYMGQLDNEIEATLATYVGLAVTEIASLRGELYGRQAG
jgi:hypothetical protein